MIQHDTIQKISSQPCTGQSMVTGESCLDSWPEPWRQLTSGTEFGEAYFQSVPQARLFWAMWRVILVSLVDKRYLISCHFLLHSGGWHKSRPAYCDISWDVVRYCGILCLLFVCVPKMACLSIGEGYAAFTHRLICSHGHHSSFASFWHSQELI